MSCYDILQQRANPGVKESGNGARLVGWTAEPRRSERRPDLSRIQPHLTAFTYNIHICVSLFPPSTHTLTVFMRIFCVACKVFSWKVGSLQHTASKGEVAKSKRTTYTVSFIYMWSSLKIVITLSPFVVITRGYLYSLNKYSLCTSSFLNTH